VQQQAIFILSRLGAHSSSKEHFILFLQDEATGDEDRSNLRKHWTKQESSLFQNKIKEKPFSQDTERRCGYWVEVPMHNEKSQWCYSKSKDTIETDLR